MKLCRLNVIFCWLILLVACSASPPSLKPLQSYDTILALGDSLTFGTGATTEQSFPSILARLTSLKVINAGVPGEETSQSVSRVENELEKYNPQLVIVCLGGNDILRKRSYQQIKRNLKIIIQTIQKHRIQVILIAVPKFGLSFNAPDFYQELGKELNIPVDTTSLPSLLKQAEYKSDYIHLNSKGYQALAEKLVALLKGQGALPKSN